MQVSATETKQVLAALSAIAPEIRLVIFRRLVKMRPGGMGANNIAEQVGIAPSSLSLHLKELVHAGLITSRGEGRIVIHAADVSVTNGLIGYLTAKCCCGLPSGLTGCATAIKAPHAN